LIVSRFFTRTVMFVVTIVCMFRLIILSLQSWPIWSSLLLGHPHKCLCSTYWWTFRRYYSLHLHIQTISRFLIRLYDHRNFLDSNHQVLHRTPKLNLTVSHWLRRIYFGFDVLFPCQILFYWKFFFSRSYIGGNIYINI
jgi:hypothetical protein